MTKAPDASIDLGQIADMPQANGLQVTKQELRDALEANRRGSHQRRLSAAQHIELARRYKDGEAGTVLAREYGVSQGSIRQMISRVERAGKMLAQKQLANGRPAPEPAETNAAAGSAPEGSESETRAPAAAAEQAPDGQASPTPDSQPGASSGETSDATGVSVAPFVREVLNVIRPMVGPARISPAALRRVANGLDRLAAGMRRRADQTDT